MSTLHLHTLRRKKEGRVGGRTESVYRHYSHDRRCVPTEAQRLERIANDEFASAQADWFVDPAGQADPDGGLADDNEWFDASWDDEAWDYPGA